MALLHGFPECSKNKVVLPAFSESFPFEVESFWSLFVENSSKDSYTTGLQVFRHKSSAIKERTMSRCLPQAEQEELRPKEEEEGESLQQLPTISQNKEKKREDHDHNESFSNLSTCLLSLQENKRKRLHPQHRTN